MNTRGEILLLPFLSLYLCTSVGLPAFQLLYACFEVHEAGLHTVHVLVQHRDFTFCDPCIPPLWLSGSFAHLA